MSLKPGTRMVLKRWVRLACFEGTFSIKQSGATAPARGQHKGGVPRVLQTGLLRDDHRDRRRDRRGWHAHHPLVEGVHHGHRQTRVCKVDITSTTAVSPLPISMILQVRGGAADDEVELERQPDLPSSHHHHPESHVLQRFLSEIWQNAQQVFQKETPIQSLKKWQSLRLCQFSAMLVVVEVQDYLSGSKWLRIECVKSGKGELTWKIGDVLPERCSKHDVITQTPPETDSDGGRGVCSQNCLFDGFRSCSMLTKCW